MKNTGRPSGTCAQCGGPTDDIREPCLHCGSVAASSGERGAYFPLQYFVDFLEWIGKRPDLYKFITYDDLSWRPEDSYPSDYRAEYARWRNEVAATPEAQDKIYVLLQHDVDSRPERSMTLLRHEERVGTPSNSMIFHKRVDRRVLKHCGEVSLTSYDLDHELMARLERDRGFVFGYHCNAFERAGFDNGTAERLFAEDVAALRTRYNIRYFSPHGGVAAPDGRNNNNITVPAELQDKIIWVHNRNSAIFDANYSDGGLNNKKRPADPRNLMAFARTWKAGHRYRILIHPQYYHDVYREAPVLSQSRWYRDILDHYTQTPQRSIWEQALG